MLYFPVLKCIIYTKYYRFSFILLLKIENIRFFTGIPSLLFLQQFKQTSRIFHNVFLIMHKKQTGYFLPVFFHYSIDLSDSAMLIFSSLPNMTRFTIHAKTKVNAIL